MSNNVREAVEVRCTQCRFTKLVGPDDPQLPADVIIEHGTETGHKLSMGEPEP